MKKIALVFFILPLVLTAQINERDTLRLKADLSLTGFWQGGNVETLIFRAKSGLSFQPWKKWVFKTQNSYVFQEFGKEKADEDFLSLNFLYINPERKFYPLILGFASTNFRREIDIRYLFGGGFSYQIFTKNKDWLKMSLTGEYEQTNFKRANFNLVEYNTSKSINTFRSTLWMNGRYYIFKNKMILTHEMFFQPSLEDSDNFRWRADVALELPVWKFLNFKINYLRTYESIVITGQKQEDEFLTFGLTLKNY
ncbi:DUF481 domain-containing protein [Pseudotenacibaculum sp. MALMAid0570]